MWIAVTLAPWKDVSGEGWELNENNIKIIEKQEFFLIILLIFLLFSLSLSSPSTSMVSLSFSLKPLLVDYEDNVENIDFGLKSVF